tara:strand:- start:522 stop:1226 length:705 start_codon:yes stop_codon:yes gene_type:complete
MSIQLEMVTIYILELEDNKYYIGRSKKKTDAGIQSRIKAHFNGKGASWTKKYQPIKIVDIKKDQTVYDENKWTKIYMQQYGIENVRGGDYVRVKLPKGDVEKLQRELDGANDRCHRCGETGHFIRFCKNKKKDEKNEEKNENKKEEVEEVIIWECELCLKHYSTEKECEMCENQCQKNKVLNNLLKRFKNIHYGDIERLCKKYDYHGGRVSKEIRNSVLKIHRLKNVYSLRRLY